MEFRRAAKVIALSAALHGPILGGYAYHNSKSIQGAVLAVEESARKSGEEKANHLHFQEREELKGKKRSGEISMGEFIIRAGDIDERAKGRGFDVERSVADYKARHYWFNEYRKRGVDPKDALYDVAFDLDYHGGMRGILGRDILQRSLNCETTALLAAALAYDSGLPVSLRSYARHLAAVIMLDDGPYDPQRGGRPVMKGAPFAASMLIDMYDSWNGGLAYPHSEDGYPGWIPLFQKSAFSAPKKPEGEKQGAQDRHALGYGENGLPPLERMQPPNIGDILVNDSDLSVGSSSFLFTAPNHNLVGLDNEMERFSKIILYGTVSARFTSTSTPIQDAIWSGALAGMLQKIELDSAMTGRYQIILEARSRKRKAIEDGLDSLGKDADPVKSILKNHEEPDEQYLFRERMLIFLPPLGPRILGQLMNYYSSVAQGDHGHWNEIDRMIELAQLPGMEDYSIQAIGALSKMRQAFIAYRIQGVYGDSGFSCQYTDFCKVIDLERNIERDHGISEAKETALENSVATISQITWKADFSAFEADMDQRMKKYALDGSWKAPILANLDDELHSVKSECKTPSDACDRGSKDRLDRFLGELRAFVLKAGK